MAKHKRWSDKPQTNPVLDDDDHKTPEEIIPEKPTNNLKSYFLSGTKYVYIVAIAALFSGIFTPITVGVEIESVIFGILSIILGLVGAILIIKGVKTQQTIKIVTAGLALIFISLFTMWIVAGKTLFGFSI